MATDDRYLASERADLRRHIESVMAAFTLQTGWVIDGISLRTEVIGVKIRYHLEFSGSPGDDIEPLTPDPRRTRPL